ncbi:MAG: hypothetical protein ABSB33_05220 [Tepidisphaeraceae bacterium]|jgi:chromosome segregation ATPase
MSTLTQDKSSLSALAERAAGVRKANAIEQYRTLVNRANAPQKGDGEKLLALLPELEITPAEADQDIASVAEVARLEAEISEHADRLPSLLDALRQRVEKLKQLEEERDKAEREMMSASSSADRCDRDKVQKRFLVTQLRKNGRLFDVAPEAAKS